MNPDCLSWTVLFPSRVMEVSAEAKRIMVVALGKLYSSRTQRGGLRLHRSLLLSLVMKSARDIYHEAQATAEPWERRQHTAEQPAESQGHQPQTGQEEEEDARTNSGAQNKENVRPPTSPEHSRKRRNKTAAEPDFLPYKKAKLEQGMSPQQHVIANTVLMDYVTCGGETAAAAPAPMALHRAVAVC